MHPKPKSHKYRLVPNCRKKTLIEIFFYLALTWKTLKIFVFLSKKCPKDKIWTKSQRHDSTRNDPHLLSTRMT